MKEAEMSALVLMSTFNGEKHLREQLDSIRSQQYDNWVLLIRDDGSKDATVDIIQEYQRLDLRINLISDTLGNLKPARSFSALMEMALTRDEEYIFFSDQDDIWQVDKLFASISQLNDLKQDGLPLLVHSDLTVVNSELQLIHSSYIGYEKLKRNMDSPLKTLLVNNYVTGCTIGMNRALLKIATPVPDHAFMHDWWCALCAGAFGKIGFVEKATVLYRQHGGNLVGSNGFYSKFLEIFKFSKNFQKRKIQFNRRFLQAEDLLERMNNSVMPEKAGIQNGLEIFVKNFSSIRKKNILQRLITAIQLKLQPCGNFRKLLFFFFLGFS